jgi:hypothetical protein
VGERAGIQLRMHLWELARVGNLRTRWEQRHDPVQDLEVSRAIAVADGVQTGVCVGAAEYRSDAIPTESPGPSSRTTRGGDMHKPVATRGQGVSARALGRQFAEIGFSVKISGYWGGARGRGVDSARQRDPSRVARLTIYSGGGFLIAAKKPVASPCVSRAVCGSRRLGAHDVGHRINKPTQPPVNTRRAAGLGQRLVGCPW